MATLCVAASLRQIIEQTLRDRSVRKQRRDGSHPHPVCTPDRIRTRSRTCSWSRLCTLVWYRPAGRKRAGVVGRFRSAYTSLMYRYEQQGKLVTQIGSLPFSDVDRAVAYSLEHEIPFLPELTQRGDAMMKYVKDPGHLSCLDAFKRHR
ncbi:hypothetical protein ACFLS0_07420, partial [Candidatus Bipolaricaulota bacterium]